MISLLPQYDINLLQKTVTIFLIKKISLKIQTTHVAPQNGICQHKKCSQSKPFNDAAQVDSISTALRIICRDIGSAGSYANTLPIKATNTFFFELLGLQLTFGCVPDECNPINNDFLKITESRSGEIYEYSVI